LVRPSKFWLSYGEAAPASLIVADTQTDLPSSPSVTISVQGS
jgi:hypothetical protein